jgi:hypothetical protein
MIRTQPACKPSDLIRDEADLLAAGLELQHQGLDLLLAEMRALAMILPGENTRLPTDAEIEAAFDNMPI